MQNLPPHLTAIPENNVVVTWQPARIANQPPSREACFMTRLISELSAARVDVKNLHDVNKQANFEASCWRHEYERVLASYWKVCEEQASLLGQNGKLKEQLKSAAKHRRAGREYRGISDAATNTGNDSSAEKSGEEDYAKQGANQV